MQSPTSISDEILALFTQWMDEARKSEPDDPDAACLATVGPDNAPSARIVLVRWSDERGFTFFTNYQSRKGSEILANPKAALCFHWKSTHKQIRIEGRVEQVTDQEADRYFNSRPRESRIGAWASLQSSPMPDRNTLMSRVAEFEKKFEGMENPPRPPHWSGFRIVPHRIEFWKQTEFRLHERKVFYIKDGVWENDILYP